MPEMLRSRMRRLGLATTYVPLPIDVAVAKAQNCALARQLVQLGAMPIRRLGPATRFVPLLIEVADAETWQRRHGKSSEKQISGYHLDLQAGPGADVCAAASQLWKKRKKIN